MKICTRCIQPDTRPGIYFNEEGICGACLWNDQKQLIDWDSREKELLDIANWAKSTSKSNYDCVIGVSGGKDSTRQAITARDKLGLRCLLVNGEPEGITNIGSHNIENLKNLGFDVIAIRPNPKIMKKLIKRDFYKYLNPAKITEYSLWSSTYIMSDAFNIPLIIQGENVGLVLGASLTGLGTDSDALKADQCNTMASGWHEYCEVEGVEEKDLFMYHYDTNRLRSKGVKGIWLQYFMKDWSYRGNAEFSKKYGLKWRSDFDPSDIGTYIPFAQLDSNLVQVNQLLKYIKFGFGQCLDHACYDLREGRISRDEAIDLVRKYDGKCSDEFISEFCNSVDISMEEFWKVANQFRGPMWKKNEKGDWLNAYWDVLENQ